MKYVKLPFRIAVFIWLCMIYPLVVIIYFLLNNVTFEQSINDGLIQYKRFYNDLIKDIK